MKHARLRRAPIKPIDVGLIRSLFSYHPDGYFVRLRKPGPCGTGSIGDEVRGTQNKDGYLVVTMMGTQYQLHRLIYAWHRGNCPPLVDHEDRNRLNCRMGNLRELSASGNVLNSGLSKDNTTGFKGVFLDKEDGRYYARPQRDGVRKYLGRAKTAIGAARLITQ